MSEFVPLAAVYLYIAGGFVIFLWVHQNSRGRRTNLDTALNLLGAFSFPLTFPYVLWRLIVHPERPLK